jgi:hypothetical protein
MSYPPKEEVESRLLRTEPFASALLPTRSLTSWHYLSGRIAVYGSRILSWRLRLGVRVRYFSSLSIVTVSQVIRNATSRRDNSAGLNSYSVRCFAIISATLEANLSPPININHTTPPEWFARASWDFLNQRLALYGYGTHLFIWLIRSRLMELSRAVAWEHSNKLELSHRMDE